MLYKLNKDNIQKSERTEIASLSDFNLTEKDLENFLNSHLTEVIFENELMLIGQERAFQAEVDLLALDKSGILYIFELKRWESKQTDLLQVFGYGQEFGRYTYDELESLARRHGKLKSDWSLSIAHRDVFDVSLPKTDFNRDQVFVLVTNGADEETLSAANYWSSKGLKIVCMPYDVFNIDGYPYLQMRPYIAALGIAATTRTYDRTVAAPVYRPFSPVSFLSKGAYSKTFNNPTGEAVAERNTMYYIVNTCAAYHPDAWMDMVGDFSTGKAVAYGGRKTAVCRIKPGSKVYLYQNGVGIIAKGESTSLFQEGVGKYGEEEYYVPLKFDWAYEQKEWPSKVPTAQEIRQRLRQSSKKEIVFLNTVCLIDKERATKIDDIADEKR